MHDFGDIQQLQRSAGNCAIVQLLRREPIHLPENDLSDHVGPVAQRQVTLDDRRLGNVVKRSWTRPVPATIHSWLGFVDHTLGGGARASAVGPGGAGAAGAEYLCAIPGNVLTKTYVFDGTAAGPDALVSDLVQVWSPLATAPQSFRSFLQEIWQQIRAFPPAQFDDRIYELYGGQPLGVGVQATNQDEADLANLVASGLVGHGLVGWNFVRQGGYFLHAESPFWQRYGQAARSRRFYLNPGPNYQTAVAVFDGLLRGFLTTYGGKGKIIPASHYGQRSDTIVLWVPKTGKGTARVAKTALANAAVGQGAGRTIPAMVRPVAPHTHVGTAGEPAGQGLVSFGQRRAGVLAAALTGAADFEAFLVAAQAGFAAAGIPWKSPHKKG